jgi:hypothetical protein
VARAELDDRTLTLHGRDLPVESVELVRVTDPEPYIEGTRRLEQVWARYHDKDTIELNQLERSSNDATYARSWLGWRCRGSW